MTSTKAPETVAVGSTKHDGLGAKPRANKPQGVRTDWLD